MLEPDKLCYFEFEDMNTYSNIGSNKNTKILFVCDCNICRSPMAEFIFKDMTRNIPNIKAESAGLYGDRMGAPIYPRAKDCLKMHGIAVGEHKARIFRLEDYFEYDYIVCTHEWAKCNVKHLTGGDPMNKVFKLLEFSDRKTDGMSEYDVMMYTDILDPHMSKNFERTYAEIYEGCIGLRKFVVNSL